MHNQLKIFKYFKSSLEDAFFEIVEILDNPNHLQYENLISDVASIDLNTLEDFVTQNNIHRFLDETENQHLEKCKWFLISKIQHGISEERLKSLVENQLPFNSINCDEIEIEDNCLISVKYFDLFSNSFKYKDYVYNITPITPGSNSSYWISQTISNLVLQKGLNFRIRLDPFIEIHHTEFSPMFYKMTIYGKSLDWERLKTLRDEEFGQWLNEDSSKNNITDYVWRPENDEIHFTCEELPNFEEVNFRGSRYFHAIFDKHTGEITHCDGALRVYTTEELLNRQQFHVRKAEVRKVGKRIKVFQLDENISQEIFSLLITNFMVWNYDVLGYFNPK
ncbi:hypothetical protein [Pedobacter glucosidilyticus]|uniref:hypothetical protein n=1 Tax=Pedobacter glucosidilyticus TaxID=1122941 RepID=UPI0026F0E3CC|nr:hypothetical protein [Pedobacter glucosidilyticus]